MFVRPLCVLSLFLTVSAAADPYPFYAVAQSGLSGLTITADASYTTAEQGYDILIDATTTNTGQSQLQIAPVASYIGGINVHAVRVNFTGPPGSYLAFSFNVPATSLSWIKHIGFGRRYSLRPIIASFINVGQLGIPGERCNVFSPEECGFSFSGYASIQLSTKPTSTSPENATTANIVTPIESTGYPGSVLGDDGNADIIQIDGKLLDDITIGGELNALYVHGDLGIANSPTQPVVSALYYDLVRVGDEAHASDLLGVVETRAGGNDSIRRLGVFGDLHGIVLTGYLRSVTTGQSVVWASVGGDVDGLLAVLNDVAPSGVSTQRTIEIGGQLLEGGLVAIGGTLQAGSSSSKGGVHIATASGLKGQVVINGGDGSPAGTWGGDVQVDSLPVLAHPGPSDGAYPLPSSTYGGGAVGLVPYHLYAADCVPPHHEDWSTPAGEALFFDSQLNGTIPNTPAVPVRMRFYGPVKTNAPADETPVAVWLWIRDTTGHIDRWQDITGAFTISVNRAGNTSREISLTRAGGHGTLPPGYYAVTVDRTSPGKLYCDGTSASAPPSVGTNMVNAQSQPVTEYHFTIFPDCNNNGVWDAIDIANGTPDSDGNGIPDACVAAAEHCRADLDDGEFGGVPDNGVDINDLVFFLYGYENGIAVVDLDDGSMTGTPDGGVDINDLLFFLAHYEAGC